MNALLKSLWLWVVSIGSILVIESGLAASSPVELVKNGTPQGVVLIAPDAPDSVQFAARELVEHIRDISGASLEIVSEKEGANSKLPVVVSLGDTTFASDNNISAQGLPPDGFRISAARGAMVIVGRDYKGPPLGDRRGRTKTTFNTALKINAHGETGTQFGVYRFLMDLGVRWYMPGDMGRVIPKTKNVAYDGESIQDAPHFPYRVLHGFDFNLDTDAAIWYKRIGFGSTHYVNLNHSMTDWAKRFSKTHPEYFATINGKPHFETVKDERRVILNYTEPGVLDQVVSDALAYFDANPGQSLFPVVPNDSHNAHDEGMATRRFISEPALSSGWLSNLVWTFVNKVAIEVNEQRPGKEVGSLAYSRQFDAPTMIDKFSPNVVVMHCRRRLNFWDEEYKQKVKDNLVAFTKLGPSRQYIWEYYNLRATDKRLQWLPYVAPHMIASDIRSLKDVSSGEFIQAEQSKTSDKLVNPAYYHINLYVTARSLWNPDLDVDAILREYNRLFYGPASEPMTKFWDLLETSWASQPPVKRDKQPSSAAEFHKDRKRRRLGLWTRVYPEHVVNELFAYLDDAGKLAGKQQPYSDRVAFVYSQFVPMRVMAMQMQARKR